MCNYREPTLSFESFLYNDNNSPIPLPTCHSVYSLFDNALTFRVPALLPSSLSARFSHFP
jgi:hypothetical protein